MTGQDPADEIIGRYRDAIDRGETVDPEQVIRLHPEVAEILRHRFAALRLLDRAYASALTEPETRPGKRVRLGQQLGPYVLEAELGSGGMGTVYLARTVAKTEALPEGTEVALKVVHPHLPAKHGFLERFHREVDAGRRVRHPNVVPTYDMGEVDTDGDETLFMSMAYVEGQTLRELLMDLERVPEALVREILRKTADGLAAIHAAGIVHRDLKPENIMVTADHEVRITDLGVARLMEASQHLTSVGQFAGSVLYAAPEQFRGDEIEARADLYALGVVAYELLSGENPFRHDASMAVMRAHLESRPPPLVDGDAEVSAFLSAVVAQLLAKDPARRFPSASGLREVLSEGEASDWWARRELQTRTQERQRPRIPVRRETRLHGRAGALERLEHAWERAREGSGSALLVVGEAGIGKTRLVDAFLETIRGEDAHVLYGSYAPSYEAGGLAAAILDHFGSAGLEGALLPYLKGTPSLVPAIAATVLRREGRAEAAPLPIDALQAAIADLMRAMAAEQPLLWIVDDLHHASGESRKVLLAMARALENHRILLVLTTAPDLDPETTATLGRLPHVGRLELDRLSPREVVELLQDTFKSEALAERLGVKIAYKSDGVPFFVFEMIRSLKDDRFLQEHADGTFTQSRIVDEIEVPSVVRDLVRARLHDLTKEERAILDVGAVEGHEFDADLVARVLERKRVAVLQDLADVERRLGLVRAKGRGFQFDHHQIREVVYEDLTDALRADYHTLLAKARIARDGVEAASREVSGAMAAFLALHLLRGAEPEDARPYLRGALDHLHATYRHEAAVEVVQGALALPNVLEPAARLRVLEEAASSYELLGRWDEEQVALDEAVLLADETGDDTQRTILRTRLGVLHARRAEWAKSRAAYDEAFEIARVNEDPTAEGRAEAGLAGVDGQLGAYDVSEVHYERARDLARDAGDVEGEWAASSGLGGLARLRGRHEEAEVLYRESLTLAKAMGNDRNISQSCTMLATTLMKLGRYEESRALHVQAVEVARNIGYRMGEAHAMGNLGSLYSRMAQFEEARRCQERTIDIAREVGDRLAEAAGLANLGTVHLHRDDLVEARAMFEEYLALCCDLSKPDGEAWAEARLGDVDLKADDPESARTRFERALVLGQELGDRWIEGVATGNLGAALLGLGRLEEARELILSSRSLAREVRDRQGEGAAESDLAALYLLAGCEERALEHLDRCAEVSAEIGDRRGDAYVEELRGRLLILGGRMVEAREHLALAREIAQEIGGRRRGAWATLGLAEVAEASGQPLKARRFAKEALAVGRDVGSPSLRTIALCRLALLPGGDAASARETFETHGARLPVAHRIEALHLLWRSTRERDLLAQAWALLEKLGHDAPSDCRPSLETRPYHVAVREALDASPS